MANCEVDGHMFGWAGICMFCKEIKPVTDKLTWKTIDSAPRDGTEIFGHYKSKYDEYFCVVKYSDINDGFYSKGYTLTPITHWMPLPEPPTPAPKGE